MKLKPFTPDDAGGAATLHATCFPDPWPAHAFTALLATGADGFLLAESKTVVGLILFRAAADEAEILTFAVRQRARNRGLGARLLLQAVASLERLGIKHLLLEVAKDNYPALSLYKQVGFEAVGERAGYYPGAAEPVDAWIMSKQIGEKPDGP